MPRPRRPATAPSVCLVSAADHARYWGSDVPPVAPRDVGGPVGATPRDPVHVRTAAPHERAHGSRSRSSSPDRRCGLGSGVRSPGTSRGRGDRSADRGTTDVGSATEATEGRSTMSGMEDANQPECSTCHSTGYVCAQCNEADGDCTCSDGPDLVPCPDCSMVEGE